MPQKIPHAGQMPLKSEKNPADSTIHIVHVETSQEVLTIASHADWVTAVAWSDDDTRLASASRDKSVKVYNRARERYFRAIWGMEWQHVVFPFSPAISRSFLLAVTTSCRVRILRVPRKLQKSASVAKVTNCFATEPIFLCPVRINDYCESI